MRTTTLCLLVKEGEVLLAMKKRGFGVGKWNGVGGKLEEGETIEQAVLRETKEEIGVDSKEEHLVKVGNIKFYFNGKEDWNNDMHIYLMSNWEGEPRETEEMRPQWFKHEEIPFTEMWADDKHWLPRVLKANKIEGEFHFSEDGNEIKKFEIKEI